MKITSYGAALEVTGSQHLLEVNGKKILLDCGLFQGRRKEAHEKNKVFHHDPSSVDVMILTHAHIDHSGKIPHLIKKGFKGVIYCTEATKDLCKIMLMDSAYIQEVDAKYAARKLKDSEIPPEPLYTQEDAKYSLQFFKGVSYDEKIKLYDGVEVTFREAGHVLGSAMLEIDIKDQEDNKQKKFIFTGDMGRCKLPIINDPYVFKNADYLLTESTYGNRTHAPIEEGIPDLARVINRTAKRGGKVIIPSFAFERTQELIYGIHLLIDQKKIPDNLPVFIDSPLATNLTTIFQKRIELYDDDLRRFFHLDHNPFKPSQLKHVASVEESKKLNFFVGPCIIISASGMCEAGRIRHHLKNNIEDPKNTIAIVGYMAEHTLGRRIVEGNKVIKIYDHMYDMKAEVVILEAFSAHADMNDLDDFIDNIEGLRKVIFVHGEPDQSEPFAQRTKDKHGVETVIMEPEMTVEM